MSLLYEVSPKDIEKLNEIQLTELLRRLLYLEASAFSIPANCVSSSLKITVKDGGEDARIQWEEGVEKTNWLPNRFTLFQCKATQMGPQDCTNEICIEKEGAFYLKPNVKEVFDSNGCYILFFNTTCGGDMDKKRIDAFRDGIRKCGLPYADTSDIRIYDTNKISQWTNLYLPAIFSVCEYLGKSMTYNFLTWYEWNKYEENEVFDYETDESLNSHLSSLRNYLNEPKKVIRVMGLSGLGKTRLALEAFRPPVNKEEQIEQSILCSKVIYIDAANIPPGLPNFLIALRNIRISGILIVDNCEIVLHNQLSKEVLHPDSALSLLTLDFTLEKPSNDCPIIELKQLSNDIIIKLINQAHPYLSDDDVSRIADFSEGFPGMAALLAKARLRKEDNIGNLNDITLANKLLWGRGSEDTVSLEVIKACSIFDKLGFEDDLVSQRRFVAENVCIGIDCDTFYMKAQEFIEKGILDKRGRYVKVIPRPLAIRLAADWWRKYPPEKAKQLIVKDLPDGMAEALCDQMSNLHFLREARELTKDLCGNQSPFGQAEVLNTEKGSRLFRSLVEISPVDTVKALISAFENSTKEDLLKVGPGRRNLVWALEKLCFWKDTFYAAACILMRFAVAENETWGNNATNQFLQLFHTYLSGTQAEPKDRLQVIEYALNKGSKEYKKIAVEALGHVIRTHNFSRLGGVEKQGSRPPQEEWAPKVWKDAFDYWRIGLKHLTQIALGDDEPAELARKKIAEGIRGLVQYGLMHELEESIKVISNKLDNFWPEALEAIEEAIEYEGSVIPEKGKAQLKEWLKFLQPNSFADKLKILVSIPSWNDIEDENGKLIDVSNERAKEFALECLTVKADLISNLDIILNGEQRQGFTFGYILGLNMYDIEEFTDRCLLVLENVGEPNPIVLAGFLAAIREQKGDFVKNTLDKIAINNKLIRHLIDITRLIKPNEEDLQRILKLVNNKQIEIQYLESFIYGSALDHLNPDIIVNFINKIKEFGVEGALIAFEILYMYCHGKNERLKILVEEFKSFFYIPSFIEISLLGKSRDVYSWNKICSYILEADIENDLAISITENIIKVLESKDYSHDFQYSIESVLKLLLTKYRDYTWKYFSDAFLSNNFILVWNLTSLFDEIAISKRSGLISQLPNEFLIDWYEKNGEKAASVICRIIHVIINDHEGYKFHPVIMHMINSPKISDEILMRIYQYIGPRGWAGSLIPYLEHQIIALKTILDHKNIIVSQWAKKVTEYINNEITKERKRDEEQDLGIY